MKYGITYSYWSKDWEGTDYPKRIEQVRACGLDVMEVFYSRILTMSEQEKADIRTACSQNQVELYALGGFGAAEDLSQLDETGRRRAIEHSKRIIEAVSQLGIRNFSGINYGAWCDLKDPTDKPRRFEQAAKSLHEVGVCAADYGVSWNMEVVNRFESYLLNTAEEGRALALASESDSINILLDIFHGMLEEDDLAQAVRTAGDRLGHYHIGSNNRKLPHPSFQPWKEIAGAMKEIHYDKCISIEPLVHQGGSVALSGGNVWRPMLPDGCDDAMLMDLLRESLSFVKSIFD